MIFYLIQNFFNICWPVWFPVQWHSTLDVTTFEKICINKQPFIGQNIYAWRLLSVLLTVLIFLKIHFNLFHSTLFVIVLINTWWMLSLFRSSFPEQIAQVQERIWKPLTQGEVNCRWRKFNSLNFTLQWTSKNRTCHCRAFLNETHNWRGMIV